MTGFRIAGEIHPEGHDCAACLSMDMAMFLHSKGVDPRKYMGQEFPASPDGAYVTHLIRNGGWFGPDDNPEPAPGTEFQAADVEPTSVTVLVRMLQGGVWGRFTGVRADGSPVEIVGAVTAGPVVDEEYRLVLVEVCDYQETPTTRVVYADMDAQVELVVHPDDATLIRFIDGAKWSPTLRVKVRETTISRRGFEYQTTRYVEAPTDTQMADLERNAGGRELLSVVRGVTPIVEEV